MARGNTIIVSDDPKGVFKEVIIAGTPKPGQMMTLKPGVALSCTKPTYEPYLTTPSGSNGDRSEVAVLLPDDLQGGMPDLAYINGSVGRIYFPPKGEELNVLVGDVAGTGDTITIGQVFIPIVGTGKLLKTTGTPQTQPFKSLEALPALTADTLVWCVHQ